MDDICGSGNVYFLINICNKIIHLVQIIAPIIAIIALAVIITKLVLNPEDKKLPKKLKNSIIALFFVFLVPTLVKAGLDLVVSNTKYYICFENDSVVEKIFNPPEYITINENSKSKLTSDYNDYERGEERETVGNKSSKNNNKNNNDSSKDNSDVTGTPSEGNAVYFLNVGSADAILILDGGHFGMIDTGWSSKGSYVIKQLKLLGVKSLDFLMITHSHPDHTGNASKVMNNFPVNTLYIKNDGTKYPAHQSTYRNIINNAKKRGINICNVKNSNCQNITLGSINMHLYNLNFFSANNVGSSDRNRFDNVNSITTLATINGKRVYFAGDIGNYFGFDQESAVARQIGDIDVYKAAHHGYISFNNNQDALNYLKPDYTIVCNHRHEYSNDFDNRIRKAGGKKIYYTGKGTITLNIGTDGKINIKQ